MTVYVDDMYALEMGRLGRMKMSHMIADSTEELLEMGRAVGMRSNWLQKRGTSHEHFDVAKGRRDLAIYKGAKAITTKQTAIMCRRRAVTGELGPPYEAEAWFDRWLEAGKPDKMPVDNPVDSLPT